MKYLLALLLLASCCVPRKATPQIKKDTVATGHWEYYDGSEDMRWIQNNEKHKQ